MRFYRSSRVRMSWWCAPALCTMYASRVRTCNWVWFIMLILCIINFFFLWMVFHLMRSGLGLLLISCCLKHLNHNASVMFQQHNTWKSQFFSTPFHDSHHGFDIPIDKPLRLHPTAGTRIRARAMHVEYYSMLFVICQFQNSDGSKCCGHWAGL